MERQGQCLNSVRWEEALDQIPNPNSNPNPSPDSKPIPNLSTRAQACNIKRGQILRGNNFVHYSQEVHDLLCPESTFLAARTHMDAQFHVSPSGVVISDMRGELAVELLTYLKVDASSAKVLPGQPAKYYRISLDESNLSLLHARAVEYPDGPFARLIEVDEEVGADVLPSGSKTDFIVIAPSGCTPDSQHADAILQTIEQERGRSRLVQKDSATDCRVVCGTRFRSFGAHKGGPMREPRMDAVATVPCGLGGGCSYSSNAVNCAGYNSITLPQPCL